MSEEDFIEPKRIEDEDMLWRRIHPKQIVPDGDSGRSRPSSAAFKDPEMSVVVERLIREDGRDEHVYFERYRERRYALSVISARVCREYDQEVIHSPLAPPRDEELEPAHAEVVGSKKRRGIASKLAAAAGANGWVIPPPDDC